MAKLELVGNKLVIKDGSKSIPTGISTDPANPDISAVRRAYAVAAGRGVSLTPSTPDGWINTHKGKGMPVAPKENKEDAPKPPKKIAEPKPAPPKKEKPVVEAPAPKPKEPKPPKKVEEKPAKLEKKHEKPQPKVTSDWIERQLNIAGTGNKKGQEAATALFMNPNLKEFLSPEGQRGIERTDNQKAATIAVFNELSKIAKFRYYLGQVAAERPNAFPEFALLEGALGDPEKAWKLSAKSSPEVIQAADIYVRHYLLAYVAGYGGGNPKYKEEISQLQNTKRRLDNLAGIGQVSEDDTPKISLMKLQLGEAMDSDTVVASTLYVRRWYAGSSERAQDQLDVWKTPEIEVASTEPITEAPVETAPGAAVETPSEGETTVPTVTGRIGIIGDSITAGTASKGKSYADMLAAMSPDATIGKHGVSGNTTTQIRKRFERDILDHKPPYDVVVIQGGVNDIASGIGLSETKPNMSFMIEAAKSKGMQVVVFTVGPWAGSKNWKEIAQRKTDSYNAWLLAQDGKGVTVVDLSSMGEGEPPKLKKEYDYGDGLHPNMAGQTEMARLAAQRLSGMPLKKAPQTPLEKFAEANWTDLPTRIYDNTRAGKPEEVIAVTRTLPEGYATLPLALNELGRTDITDGFDRMFNDYLHQDQAFLDFAKSRKNYSALANPAVRLSASSSAADRRFVAEAVQDFIRYLAEKADDPAYAKFKDDIKVLCKAVLGLKGDELVKDGIPDMRTIAAVAVYSWRKTHIEAGAGDWAKKIPNVTIPQSIQQGPTPPAAPKKERATLEL